jgi:hypothetical protein
MLNVLPMSLRKLHAQSSSRSKIYGLDTLGCIKLQSDYHREQTLKKIEPRFRSRLFGLTIQPNLLRLNCHSIPLYFDRFPIFGSHLGIAMLILAVVNAVRAFGLLFYLKLPVNPSPR